MSLKFKTNRICLSCNKEFELMFLINDISNNSFKLLNFIRAKYNVKSCNLTRRNYLRLRSGESEFWLLNYHHNIYMLSQIIADCETSFTLWFYKYIFKINLCWSSAYLLKLISCELLVTIFNFSLSCGLWFKFLGN